MLVEVPHTSSPPWRAWPRRCPLSQARSNIFPSAPTSFTSTTKHINTCTNYSSNTATSQDHLSPKLHIYSSHHNQSLKLLLEYSHLTIKTISVPNYFSNPATSQLRQPQSQITSQIQPLLITQLRPSQSQITSLIQPPHI